MKSGDTFFVPISAKIVSPIVSPENLGHGCRLVITVLGSGGLIPGVAAMVTNSVSIDYVRIGRRAGETTCFQSAACPRPACSVST